MISRVKRWAGRKWRTLLGRTALVKDLRTSNEILREHVNGWRKRYDEVFNELKDVYNIGGVPTLRFNLAAVDDSPVTMDVHRVYLRPDPIWFAYTGTRSMLRSKMMAEEIAHRASRYIQHSLPAQLEKMLSVS